ncbi:hypothetical protein FZ103_03520 [Streptomonospora sp. PA3]|uniref:S26 family signal peptidase n=1 Tax=Streptomonospora sp. PA3 TaxID=2607326 RepID=UPI0012DC395B|nr:S26 family signal peptidase [Streptomonospora sp. PA3]MUL40256.1 hypothetical protein [Streptomonospora sp. PA3]
MLDVLLAGIGAAVPAVAASAWWTARHYAAVTVEGESMSPALHTGDRVLIRRGARRAGRGAVVVVVRPRIESGWRNDAPASGGLAGGDWSIKRVAAAAGDPYPESMRRAGTVPEGHIAVLGDNPVSVDSKQHGPCPEERVLGVVIRRLGSRRPVPPAARTGPDSLRGAGEHGDGPRPRPR